MGYTLGLDCKLYRNTATYSTPTWSEITNVRDLTLSVEKNSADVSIRGSTWRLKATTLKEASIEFEMIWDHASEDFTALQTAFLNNTTVDVAAMDGAITTAGTQGLRAIMNVEKFSREEPLEEAVKVKVTLTPAYDTTNLPTWMTVAS